MDFIAFLEERTEAGKAVDHRLMLPGRQLPKQRGRGGGRALAGRDDQAAGRCLALARAASLAERFVVEPPVTRRAADRDQPPRPRKGAQPLPLCKSRLRALDGIADREWKLEQ